MQVYGNKRFKLTFSEIATKKLFSKYNNLYIGLNSDNVLQFSPTKTGFPVHMNDDGSSSVVLLDYDITNKSKYFIDGNVCGFDIDGYMYKFTSTIHKSNYVDIELIDIFDSTNISYLNFDFNKCASILLYPNLAPRQLATIQLANKKNHPVIRLGGPLPHQKVTNVSARSANNVMFKLNPKSVAELGMDVGCRYILKKDSDGDYRLVKISQISHKNKREIHQNDPVISVSIMLK